MLSILCIGLNANILKIQTSNASLGLGWALNFEYELIAISYISWQNSSSIFAAKFLISWSDELLKTFSIEALCKIEIKLFNITSYSGDSSSIFDNASYAPTPSPLIMASTKVTKNELSIVPSNSLTLFDLRAPLPWAIAWSNNVNASLTDPEAASEIKSTLSSS